MPETVPIENLWQFLRENSAAIGPQLQLIIWGLGILCVDFLIPSDKKDRGAIYALGGLIMASIHLYSFWGTSLQPAFYNMMSPDSFALYFNVIFLLAAFLSVIMSYRYLDIEHEQHTEYYALILFATAGMMFMASAIDLVSIFISLELMSISTYVLVGFLRGRKRSNEASMKYFLLGAFSTGIILYGMSLLYGLSGSTNLHEIARQVSGLGNNSLLVLSMFMILAGLCFKIAAVPFHMWAPDAYEGAPTSITAFMSVAVKAGAFAIFFRIFYVAFGSLQEVYVLTLAVISMLTITWGNVAALTQTNVKRLLAYSSISHAGFVLMGLVAGTELGVRASAIYLLAYTFMNMGVWAVVILLRRQDIPGENLEDFDGLFFKQPVVAVLMLVFFLSLAGMPPFAGFIAKYFVFAAIVQAAFASPGPQSTLMVWVAVVGALNVVLALYYYLRFVVSMFIRKDFVPAPLSFSTGLLLTLIITGLFTVLIGIYPEPFYRFAESVSLPLV